MAKKVLLEKNFFDNDTGDIIDRITKEHEYLTGKENPSPNEVKADEENQSLASVDLESVLNHYRKKFVESEKAQDYLKSNGLTRREIGVWFNPGFSDGTIVNLVSERQKKELQSFGILDADLKDRYQDSLAFTLSDDESNLKRLYGININSGKIIKPLNNEVVFFNEKALEVYRERVLVCLNLIDCLCLFQLGFDNALSVGDEEQLAVKHYEKLKAKRIKELVIVANCRSETEVEAGLGMCELAVNYGMSARLFNPRERFNSSFEMIRAGKSKKEIEELIKNLTIFSPEKQAFRMSRDGIYTVFEINGVTYKLSGVKESFVNSLKVNIRAELGDQ